MEIGRQLPGSVVEPDLSKGATVKVAIFCKAGNIP